MTPIRLRPPRSLTFDHNKVIRQLENESFYSSILNIQVNEKSQAAIVKDIQRHPSKPQIMHMDFQRIVEDEKIRMNVPIHYLNAEDAAGVKEEGGSVSQLITDVEVTLVTRGKVRAAACVTRVKFLQSFMVPAVRRAP